MAAKQTSILVDTIPIAGKNIRAYLRKRGGIYQADIHYPDRSRTRFSTDHEDIEKATRSIKGFISDPAFHEMALKAVINAGHGKYIRSVTDIGKVCTYYNEVYLKNRNASRKTLLKTVQVLRDFQDFCARKKVKKISAIDRQLIDLWLAELLARPITPKSTHNYIAIVRAAMNAAAEAEMIPPPQIRRWPKPKLPEVAIEPLTLEQVREILFVIKESEPGYYPIYQWLAFTGCRPSDALDLRFGQVDLKRRIVQRTQKKTRRLGTYEISQQAALVVKKEKLRRGGKPGDRVFVDAAGNPFTEHRIYHQFTRALQRAGKEVVNPYRLRHTFGFNMANAPQGNGRPCPLPVLQRMMGHSDIKTTMRYVLPSEGFEYTEAYSDQIERGA